MKFLLMSDDTETVRYIAAGLRALGHGLEQAGLHDPVPTGRFDLVLLDGALPHPAFDVPVLMLCVAAEGAGGMAQLVKPFAFFELMARIAALVKPPDTATKFRAYNLEIDIMKRTVKRGAVVIDLEPLEFILLEYMMRHSGLLLTRAMLLQDVFALPFRPRAAIVETHIRRLAEKVDEGFAPRLIQTVAAEGFVLDAR